MKNLFFLFLPVLFFVSCDKYSDGDFSGILASDIDGVVFGQLGDDDGDWELDDVFTEQEELLFDRIFVIDQEKITDLEINEDTSLNSIIWAITPISVFPTLTSDYLHFYSSYDNSITNLQIVIVDKYYDVLFEFEQVSDVRGSISFKVDLEDIGVALDQIHRVYYKVTVEGSHEHCGHGDFMFTENQEDYF